MQVSGGVRNEGKMSEFNGIIGMLEREEVDIAGTDLFMTAQRIKVQGACIDGSVLNNFLRILDF